MLKGSGFYLICCAFLGNAIASQISYNATEQVAKEIQRKTLPNKVLAVNETEVPFMKQGEFILEQMCANANSSNYENAQSALRNIWTCFQGVIDFSKLPKEIEEAKPKGNLDEVFPPYCRLVNELKGCVQTSVANITPCFSDDQKLSRKTIDTVTDTIFKFACERDGDYIALFIAEKGPQCISSKQPGIEQCVRKGLNRSRSYDEKINYTNYEASLNNTNENELPSLNGEPEKPFSLAFDLESCRTAYKIRNCIIQELLKCSDKTPANVVESIFNLIQRSTTCSKYSRTELSRPS